MVGESTGEVDLLDLPAVPDLARMRRERGAKMRSKMQETGIDAVVLLAACRPGGHGSDLPDAYAAADESVPLQPIAADSGSDSTTP